MSELWGTLTTPNPQLTPSETRLTLQSLIFEFQDRTTPSVTKHDVKSALLNSYRLCEADPQLQIKWCQLAVLALNAVQCTFTTTELNGCVGFVLDVCAATNYIYCAVDALGALLYNADLNALSSLNDLIGEDGMVLQLCLGQAPEREVQHLALRCLNNMLISVHDEVFVSHIVCTLTTLATSRLHGDNLNRTRLLSGVMKCLQTIAKYTKSQYCLEQILSTVKGCMFEGISNISSPAISLESLSLDEVNLSDMAESPARQSQPRVRIKKGRNKKKKPPPVEVESVGWRKGTGKQNGQTKQSITKPENRNSNRYHMPPRQSPRQPPVPPPPQPESTELNKNMGFQARQADFTVSTSESEYSESDNEEGQHNKVLAVKCRTRLSSLLTLHNCISSVQKSSMYNVWTAFLPPDSSAGLLFIIQQEQNVKCRIAALGALTALIAASKHYFLAADSRPGAGTSKAPYTPFSETLATALTSLHADLLQLVPSCHQNVLSHLLQCIAVLTLHTPFSKLTPGIITKVLEECCPLISSNTPSRTQSAALNLLCACFTVETPLREVSTWLAQNHHVLVRECLENTTLLPYHKDVLQVLCQLLRFYFSPISAWWSKISDHSISTLHASSDTLIQNMCLLVLEELGKALATALDSGTFDIPLDHVKKHWDHILGTVIVPILQTENSVIAPGTCDIISTVGNTVFAVFPAHTQRLIMTLLLALTNPTIGATSSACRCLGVLVTYPCIRDDLLFVADTANAIIKSLEATQSTDSGLLFRVSWSLGNLSDTLVVNKLNNPTFVTDFSDMLLGRLFDVSLKSANENDKVKSNIVRALGNLLRFIKQSTYEKAHFTDYVTSSVKCLLKCCTTGMMKTRWNACYALVHMLQNPILCPAQSTWGEELFTTLCNVIIHCNNFKVRINATLALAQCATREHYGDCFIKVWAMALAVLCDCGSATSGVPLFGYCEKLRLQLLLLVCHLITQHVEEDRVTMVTELPASHYHGNLISQSSGISTSDQLSATERTLVNSAHSVCIHLTPQFDLICNMLQLRKLPSDTEAFITSDISKKL